MVLIAVVAGVAIWWTGRTPPRRVNVVIVSIDTLSARVVASMRTLSKLAVRGTAFTNARTVAPLTLPAHATLLTGLEPPAHGIRDNTAAPLPPPGERPFSTLAEEFKDAGYATAAFVAASVLDRRFRLDAGFDEYRQARSPEPGRPSFFSLDAEEQVKRFRAWMGQRPADRPFFAWVHLWEPHAPYRPYAGDEYGDKTEAHDPAEVRYLGEVRRADAALAAILAAVDLETTVVVVTSDHGEALGAHGEKTHGLLCYGATMDIPLVLAGPGVPPGTRDVACGIVDVAPTVRRLAGLSVRAGDGRDLFDDGPRVVCGESLYAHRRYRWAQWSVATDGRFSLLSGGPRLELFDRSADSGETHPLDAPTTHEAYARLDQALLAYRARRRDRAGERAGLLRSDGRGPRRLREAGREPGAGRRAGAPARRRDHQPRGGRHRDAGGRGRSGAAGGAREAGSGQPGRPAGVRARAAVSGAAGRRGRGAAGGGRPPRLRDGGDVAPARASVRACGPARGRGPGGRQGVGSKVKNAPGDPSVTAPDCSVVRT
ncbi:MAG: sulfatase [Planctomycetota bacterium]|nr:sulfatase [Planctomycetota bacterium]